MITEILSGVWIGNLDELTNTQFFKDNEISVIFNCTLGHHISSHFEGQKIRIPVSELNEPSSDFTLLKQNLPKLLTFIHSNIDEKNICFIGYNNYTIPLIIVSIYMIKIGQLKKNTILAILQSKNTQFQLDYDLNYFL